MAKFVKLGEKATIFYDPTLSFKVITGEVKELPSNYRFGKRTVKALQGGHLVLTDKNDTLDKEDEELTAEVLKAYKKADLVAKALELKSEYSEEELNSMTKAELIEEVLSL